MSAFGLIIPGRPVDAGFQQVESNKFLITVPGVESINHVVLFLTGLAPLPLGMAGCIYFSWPEPTSPPDWHYLGYLTNEKPSAIYRLTNLSRSHKLGDADKTITGFNYAQPPVTHVAQIGISVEPLNSALQMVPVVETTASKTNTFTEFINKTVGNLYNYCSSFSRPVHEILSDSAQNHHSNSAQYVPLTSIQSWYENYTRKLRNDQNFWKNLN